MKRSKLFWLPIVAVLVLFVVNAKAFADQIVQDFVDQFNAMNSNQFSDQKDQGFRFTLEEIGSGVHFLLTARPSTEYVNVDAYSNTISSKGLQNQNYFTSFCVGPTIGAPTNQTLVGKLNYNDDRQGHTRSYENDNDQGFNLSVGAAYLYMLYATSQDTSPFGLPFDASEFDKAINFLNGVPSLGTNWDNNQYLVQLESMRFGRTVWEDDYVVGKSYSFSFGDRTYDLGLGDYYVFVLNVQDLDGRIWQNYIYIAQISGTPEVPEPATMLLWSLGGLGMAGSWLRQRRMKKLVA